MLLRRERSAWHEQKWRLTSPLPESSLAHGVHYPEELQGQVLAEQVRVQRRLRAGNGDTEHVIRTIRLR